METWPKNGDPDTRRSCCWQERKGAVWGQYGGNSSSDYFESRNKNEERIRGRTKKKWATHPHHMWQRMANDAFEWKVHCTATWVAILSESFEKPYDWFRITTTCSHVHARVSISTWKKWVSIFFAQVLSVEGSSSHSQTQNIMWPQERGNQLPRDRCLLPRDTEELLEHKCCKIRSICGMLVKQNLKPQRSNTPTSNIHLWHWCLTKTKEHVHPTMVPDETTLPKCSCGTFRVVWREIITLCFAMFVTRMLLLDVSMFAVLRRSSDVLTSLHLTPNKQLDFKKPVLELPALHKMSNRDVVRAAVFTCIVVQEGRIIVFAQMFPVARRLRNVNLLFHSIQCRVCHRQQHCPKSKHEKNNPLLQPRCWTILFEPSPALAFTSSSIFWSA